MKRPKMKIFENEKNISVEKNNIDIVYYTVQCKFG